MAGSYGGAGEFLTGLLELNRTGFNAELLGGVEIAERLDCGRFSAAFAWHDVGRMTPKR